MRQPNIDLNPSEERTEYTIEGKRTLVIGCGNVLLGDDGFGPAVIKALSTAPVPPDAALIDAGTGVRKILFNVVLSSHKPAKIIILDAIQKEGRHPGEVFKIPLNEMPPQKAEDFAVHHIPTTNMLAELQKDCGVKVTIIAAQVSTLPSEMSCALSEPVKKAVLKAAELVMTELNA
jgi:coenzyme F420 hydrogenase subunit delta